jgi:hypothetical protein
MSEESEDIKLRRHCSREISDFLNEAFESDDLGEYAKPSVPPRKLSTLQMSPGNLD